MHPVRPTPAPRWRAATAAALTSLLLAACGSGGSDTNDSPDAPPVTPELAQPFDAVGSSASTVSLAWTPPVQPATYTIERRGADGRFSAVATVDARSGAFLDSGLVPGTGYAYRLASTGAGGAPRSETPARNATTTDELPVVTARGAPLGELTGRTLGTAGGQLQSHDGLVTVELPPGALQADTATETQPVANTAPDGRGTGLAVRLAALPRLPLTLKLRYAPEQDDEADGLRIALQRPGGDWISLPLTSIDKTTRTLQAQVPPEILATGTAGALSAAPRAATVGIEFHVVRYLAFHLKPRTARVKVGQTLELVPYARVRGYDTEIGTCEPLPDGRRICILQPMLETRELPFTNDKPGYIRSWWVSAVKGGNATVGTIVPRGAVGAVYTAPATVPNPSTVRVLFHSLDTSTLRKVDLIALVDVWDDAWTGQFTAIDGPSIAGTTLTSVASVRWAEDAAASSGTVKVYRATGSVQATVTDDNCTVSLAPDTAPVATDTRLVELRVDEGTSPMTYSARLITFWPALIGASCPNGSAQQWTQMAGWGWEVQGRVEADGRTIVGDDVTDDGYRLSWRFTR
jgi:hypothetical protein